MATEKATFAAGCFWGVEANFRSLPGVTSTKVGYIGGHMDKPTYQDVCSGETAHAEAVQIEYNPQQISYDALLKVFWANHDPTTLNRQGPDVGTQYRSAIFFHDKDQEAAANASSANLNAEKFAGKITTLIVPAATFYDAEEYHQQYLEKRGQTSCGLRPSNDATTD